MSDIRMHVPVIAPHYVQNGPAVSISFSVTFRTHDSDARAALYRMNRNLRKIGEARVAVGVQHRQRPALAHRLGDEAQHAVLLAAAMGRRQDASCETDRS